MNNLSKIFLVIIIGALFLPVLFSATAPSASAFSGAGAGTAGDPYVITTDTQLQEMNNNKTAYYVLGNDITMTHYQTGSGFTPIGSNATQFKGTLDGQGYEITNLYENRPSETYVGFFGDIGSGGVVKNVGLINENIIANMDAGGLAGNNSGAISNSYTTGTVAAGTEAGGFVSQLLGGTITNCYSACTVNGSAGARGGLVGLIASGTVSKCYSVGPVNGTGGLIGNAIGGTTTNSFWDTETSGQATSAGGAEKTTTQMKTKATFTDNGWDFVAIWNIHPSGYPVLLILTPNNLPTVPSNFTDLGTRLLDHTPAITWTEGTDADGDTVTTYVYVGTTSTPTTEETHNTDTGCDLGNTVTLNDGTTYYYRLRSWDGYGWSDYTVADEFRMNGRPTNPTSFTNLGMGLENRHPTVTWSGQTDADGDPINVYVYVGQTSTPTTVEDNTTAGTIDLGYTAIFSSDTTYYYRLQSYDGYEFNGSYTIADEFSTGTLPQIGPPIIANFETENQANPATLLYKTNPVFSWLAYDLDNMLFENTTEISTGSGGFVLGYKWTTTYAGAFGITFDLRSTGGSPGAEGRIYKNGNLVGRENNITTSASYVTFTEFIDNWQVGDNVQLYYRHNGDSETTYAENFRIYGDTQTKYEMWVGTSLGGADKWASGVVSSSAKSVTYAGSALVANTTYYAQVRISDPYEWSGWTTGTFRMITRYNIRLRWEENAENANVNATLTAYMGSGAQENAVTAGVLSNVTYSERPYWMQLTYGDYFRSYVPTADNGTLYFYVTDSASLAAYTFQLVDLTGMYGPPTGRLIISKMIGASSVILYDSPWQADLTVLAYLRLNNMYQLTVKSDLAHVRSLGGYAVGLTSPILVQVGTYESPDLAEIWSNIYWAAWRMSDNTTIRAAFEDNTGDCLTASVSIYDENGTLCQFFAPDNGDFVVTWLDSHPDSSYTVVLYETRDDENLPLITFSTPISAIWTSPVVTPTGGLGLGNPIPFLNIFSFFILCAMGMAFDIARPQMAAIAISLTALLLMALGWLDISIYTIFLIVGLSVLCSLGFKRFG